MSSKVTEIDKLKETLMEEQRQKEEALKLWADKENELNKPQELSFETWMNHSSTKKLWNAVNQLQAKNKIQQQMLEDERQKNEALMFENKNQKIKHFQKIKEENNFLKRELLQQFQKNRGSGSSSATTGESESSTQIKLAKLQQKYEKRSKDLKDVVWSTNKICEYILTRPQLPPEVRAAIDLKGDVSA